MEIEEEYFNTRKQKAEAVYFAKNKIYNPYFKTEVVLNSDGFHHLQFSARRERNKKEQLFKFSLVPFGLEIIKKSGTIQEYRKLLTAVGKRLKTDGSIKMKEVEYWGLVAIVGENKVKVRTVLRRVGDGNITFWSVMLYSKRKNGHQNLFVDGIEDE